MTLEAFSVWLAATPASNFVRDVSWMVQAVQTVHILAIAVVLSSMGMVALRILELAGTRATMVETTRRYGPWLWSGLGVLLASGVVLVIGEPERDLQNWAFQTKMALVVAMALVTIVFERTVKRGAPFWDRKSGGDGGAKVAALAAVAVWLAIAVLGRWIAYI